MRVLHVLPSLDPETGGTAQSVSQLCEAEAGIGIDVALAAFRSGRAASSDRLKGVHLNLFEPLPGTRQGLTFKFLSGLRTLMRDQDLLHVHSLWNAPTAAAAALSRRYQIPYVVSPHGMLQVVPLARKRLLKMAVASLVVRRMISKSAGVHFASQFDKEESRLVDPRHRTLVAPNGIDTNMDKPSEPGLRTRFPDLKNSKIVLFVGRLHWSKNLDLQLDAVWSLSRRRSDFRWVLVGPDEGVWPRLKEAVKRRGLEEFVLRVGSLTHEQALAAIADADAVLLTSRHEAHSLVMNEALVLGAPLILTTSVGAQDLEERGAAIVVHPSPDELCEAIDRLLIDETAAQQLTERGRRYASAELSWQEVASNITAFYAEILRQEAR